MVTRIEIGSYKIDKVRSITGQRTEAYVISPEKKLLGQIPDEAGMYDIDGGKVEIGFRSDPNGHRFVELDLKNSELGRFLKGGKERSVCVSNIGEGCIFLPKGRVLFVRTDANDQQFLMREKKKEVGFRK